MSRRLARTCLSLLVAFGLVLGPPSISSAAEDGQDNIELVSLTARTPGAGVSADPGNVIGFQARVKYDLHSTPSGFLLLFAFENDAASSRRQNSAAVPVDGSGEVQLNIDYAPQPNVRTLTLMVGMFKTEQKLLTWVSTRPFDLAPWPGRAAFDRAMAARLAHDYATADSQLSAAIDAAPDTGNYYYWRGDTRIYLQQYAAAIADFDRSIGLMPDDVASRVGRGIARLWNEEPAGAVEDLSLAIARGPEADRLTAVAYRARGSAYSALNDAAAAISDPQTYLALVPDAPDRAEVESWIADLS
jgi:tetratricopeptide (TPR) repeat protein